jgi:hypothetical protein
MNFFFNNRLKLESYHPFLVLKGANFVMKSDSGNSGINHKKD